MSDIFSYQEVSMAVENMQRSQTKMIEMMLLEAFEIFETNQIKLLAQDLKTLERRTSEEWGMENPAFKVSINYRAVPVEFDVPDGWQDIGVYTRKKMVYHRI